MAVPRTAQVVGAKTIGPDTRLLDLVATEPLGFVGGQYIIVDSRLVLPSGKAVKRAYSLLTSDADQARFQLAVMRIPNGPGSGFVHGLEAGTEISFSGPWGKLFLQEGSSGATLILATDTGITAALGLIQAIGIRPLLAKTVFIWLRVSTDYFLSEDFVRERIPRSCGEFRIEAIPAIDHPERIPHARAILHQVMSRVGLARAFILGDGAVNSVLLEDLVTAGVPVTKDNVESFFNMAKKSA
jgi:ferredoxin-NADP reductase